MPRGPQMEDTTHLATEPSPTASVLNLVAGFGIFQAIYVAAKLGIPDFFMNGAKSVDAVAEQASLHGQTLYRLLRTLASVGIFSEIEHGIFQNTSLSETFATSAPGSLRPFLIMAGSPECWRSWGELLYSVETGKPAFDHIFGLPLFDYLSANPVPARIFDEAMASRSAAENAAMLAVYDFSYAKCVVDVGGGNGALLIAILKAFPHLEGVLFDMPHVVERARPLDNSNGRIHFKGGDFFGKIPSGGDAYVLKKVIHDWPDDQAQAILYRCRRAMAPHSRLVLIELVVPPGNEGTFTKFLDLWMLVWPGGKERTEAEYRGLLKSADLSLSKVIPTRSPISVIEAVPI